MQPARYSGVEQATSTPFIIKAYVDGHALTAALETAKDAFAKAIEWYIVGKLRTFRSATAPEVIQSSSFHS
jgi:hypothetical protein